MREFHDDAFELFLRRGQIVEASDPRFELGGGEVGKHEEAPFQGLFNFFPSLSPIVLLAFHDDEAKTFLASVNSICPMSLVLHRTNFANISRIIKQ